MSITEKEDAFVDSTAMTISVSQMVSVTAASTNPTYLVLTALDRDEYTAGASDTTGSFTGNGHTLSFSSIGGDARAAGIVFTYQPSTGRYYNSTYGYLDQLVYNSSSSANDVTNISLFGTNNAGLAVSYASNPYSMAEADPSGYIGSTTVVTNSKFTGTVPTQATPDSIAAIAETFVGQAWNEDGCWVLASTIAAEAGASVSVQSSLIDLAGKPNGEWIVAFNGPAGQTGNWESMVTAGEMVVFLTAGGSGHVTTVVSGSGSTAMVVDNITYVNSAGVVQNGANDGSSSDVIIAAPHLASQEFAGVSASNVVIYELDTPIVTDTLATASVAVTSTLALGPIFSATDPADNAITEWQVYDTATTDMLVLSGVDEQDHTAATALTASSLSSVSLLAGAVATSDTIEVRAYNGTYWGDWTALTVAVAGSVAVAPPVLATQTAAQTWLLGKAFALTIPAGTFTDPQHETLTETATLASGAALPGWLIFNAATDTFTGTAPTTAQTISIKVTATDTSGLSVSETFAAAVAGAPKVSYPIANQTWAEGAVISLALPANTFTDPQNEALTDSAKLSNGQALPSWLTFNASTDTFTGTAPNTTQTLGIVVTATDTSGLSTSEAFTAAVVAPVIKPAITVTDQTAAQTWTDRSTVDLVLPGNTFTDALGLKMTFAAYEVSGPNVTSWLYFNPQTETFYGAAPSNQTGQVTLEVIATDADHATATDLFTVTLAAASGHTPVGSAQFTVVSAVEPSTTTGVLAFHV